eukprot:753969-Hanusia_phi.AAC.1
MPAKSWADLRFKRAERVEFRLLAERGHICVNGGGKTGCMGALNDGCIHAGGTTIGVIHEMFVVDGEEHTGLTQMIIARGECLAERKKLLVEGADCVIALPGGVGTWDELWEVVAEVSLGFKNIPIVVINTNGFYDSFKAMMAKATEDKLIYKGPETLVRFESSVVAALNFAEKMHVTNKDSQKGKSSSGGRMEHRGSKAEKGIAYPFVAGVLFGTITLLLLQSKLGLLRV